jgi:P27 family predicted phage terminase small subunit
VPPLNGTPKKPRGLDKEAAWMWDLTVKGSPPEMLGNVDSAYLEGMCRWWSVWRSYEQAILDAGRSEASESSMDQYKLITLAHMAWNNWAKAAAKFGLTPVDRQRLRIAAETGKRNPIDELRERRNRQCGV